jgi:tRNA(adenine34) deaminase
MSLALKEAELARDAKEVPVGAVLVSEPHGTIIASTHNLCLSKNDPTAHAELLALQEAATKIDLLHTDCVLYVTLEPCSMCAGAILQSRIRKVVYGADDPKAGACGSVVNVLQNTALDFWPELTAGIMADECRHILQAFFQDLRTTS